MSDVLKQISNAVIEGQLDNISSLTNAALSSGLTAKEDFGKRLDARDGCHRS